MSYLHDGVARAAEAGDSSSAQANLHLAKQFLEQHLSRWASRLAEMAAVAGDDFYTRIAAFAADVAAIDLQQLDLCQDFGHASSKNQAAMGSSSGLGAVRS